MPFPSSKKYQRVYYESGLAVGNGIDFVTVAMVDWEVRVICPLLFCVPPVQFLSSPRDSAAQQSQFETVWLVTDLAAHDSTWKLASVLFLNTCSLHPSCLSVTEAGFASLSPQMRLLVSDLPHHTFLKVCGCFACLYANAPQKPEEGSGSPKAEVPVVSYCVWIDPWPSGKTASALTFWAFSPAPCLPYFLLNLHIFFLTRKSFSRTCFFPTCIIYEHITVQHVADLHWTWELWTFWSFLSLLPK